MLLNCAPGVSNGALLRLLLELLEFLELRVDLLVPLRLRGHVLERVEALVKAAVRRARRVYRFLAVKKRCISEM